MRNSVNTLLLRRKWREGESSPYTGKLSARPALVRPGDFLIAKESLRRSLPRHFLASAFNHTEGPQYAFLKACRNLSGPMGFPKQNQTLGWEPTTSRWSAPGPGKRTRREDHALSHRPQMSSGRLFLDRVGRHQSPSPLHRHIQHKSLAFRRANIYHRTASRALKCLNCLCQPRGQAHTRRQISKC